METSQVTAPPEAPRGIYPARVDDKGRLKLPAGFKEYLGGLTEKKLFVTSLDRSSVTIYPIALWRVKEKSLFDVEGDAVESAENVYFTSQELGAETEMDKDGRVLLSVELRRAVGMENQPVKVGSRGGVLEVTTEAAFAESQAKSRRDPVGDFKLLRKMKIV